MQDKAKRKSKGIGDTIAKITTAIGIKPCEGCEQRQTALNHLLPYNSVKLTQDEEAFILIANHKRESHKTILWELFTKTHVTTSGRPNMCEECWDDILLMLNKIITDENA
jgi:predicted RNA binding protein with dsRBD fold (UPF0201 family)